MFQKFYHNFWYRVQMVNAYLALHRGDRHAASRHEAQAIRHQSALELIDFQEAQS